MKIPFDIKYRPQIESGEYKVETKNGQPVEILKWDVRSINNRFPIAAIVSSEKFDEVVGYSNEGYCGRADYSLFLVTQEADLSEFERYVGFIAGFSLVDMENKETIEQVKKFSKKLLDHARKELVPSFGKEYESGYLDGRDDTLKDLPRWRQAYEYVFVGQSIMRDEQGFYFASIAKPGCLYITCDSLEKLPGFNE